MKNNNCKFLLLIFFAFIMMPTIVFAAHSAVGGNTSSYGSCKGYDWCYSGKTGLRFSLYKYKDSGLTYYASSDYSTNGCAYNGKTAHISKDSSGKVAYKNNKSSINWDTNTYYELKINNGASNFSCYFGDGCSNFNKTQVEKFFKINGTAPDSNAVKNQINSVFGTNISVSDLSYIYITVEPTIYIYNSNGDSFYGTIYEIMNMSNPNTKKGYELYGLNGVLYQKFPISIVATNPTSNDTNNFVGEKIRIVANANKEQPFSLTSGWDSNANQRKDSRTKIVSNDGYGIGVFWLGDYIKADCKSVCSGKSGNALLSCASNYCENDPNVTTSSKKEECVNSCGYEEVEPDSCGSMSIPSSTTSICSEERDQTKGTCVEAKEPRFYKIECSEKTTIKYSNDLPTVFQKGMGGFNYYVKTHGERKCTLTWDENYYNYKLAVTKNSLRFNLKAKKTEFDNFGKDSYDGANYSFKENDTVVLTVDGNNYSLKKTIDETTDVKYSSSSDGNKKTYSTTNEAMFELPLICYPLDSKASLLPGCNDIKKTNPNYYGFYNNNADSIVNTTYYGFYNNSTDSRVNTTTIVTKEDSGLKDTNKCYYLNQDNTLDTDVNCYLDIEGTHDENGNYSTATVSYRVVNRSGIPVICNFNETSDCDGSLKFDATSTNVKEENVNASITYIASNGEEITKQCPIKFNLKTGITPPSEIKKENNCPEKYNPSHYDAIRYYCKSSWKTDVNGYTSYTDCYNRCSSNGRKDTCKTKYSCNYQTSINSYCKNHYSDDGYKSAEMCINDCSCSSEKGLEYIYRPISLDGDLSANKYNAFPNREAGTNWKGYEAMTIDNTFENSPQYIVELTADAIEEIKQDTNDNKNKYIDYYGYNLNGYYKSYFIENKKDIFVCVNNNGGGC